MVIRFTHSIMVYFVAVTLVITALPVTPVSHAAQEPLPFGGLHQRIKQDEMKLPNQWGTIEETFKGESTQAVVLIQDAHAIPDAQKNIQKIIKHFQASYGVQLVALEGSASKLDPQFFRSYPDRNHLRLILKEYHQKGELAGGATAALMNNEGGIYHGIEDWVTYEEGLRHYLRALENEKKLLETLHQQKKELDKEKQAVYSDDLLKIDQFVQDFYESHTNLPALLTLLAGYKDPRRDTELSVLFRELKVSEAQENALASEVARISKVVGTYLENHQQSSKTMVDDLRHYHRDLQKYQTSQISARDFGFALTKIASKYRMPLKVSGALKEQVIQKKKISDIRGTQLFDELNQHIVQVKRQLFLSDEKRALDQRTQRLLLLEQFAKLELTQTEWLSVRQMDRAQYDARAFQSHFAFYENAKARDGIFYQNLKSLYDHYGKNSAVLVAGGFHTEGLKELLKKNEISYLLVMPAVKKFPKKINYRAHMKGDVSWKDYLQVESGKVSNAKAFTRATRDRLLSSEAISTGLLKAWRDQIIRDLARQKRVEEAKKYTRYLDEMAGERNISDDLDMLSANVRRFVSGVKKLQINGQLNQQNVMNLLKVSTAVPVLTAPNILGSELADVELTKGQVKPEESDLAVAASETRVIEDVKTNIRNLILAATSVNPFDHPEDVGNESVSQLQSNWRFDRGHVERIEPHFNAPDVKSLQNLQFSLKQIGDEFGRFIPNLDMRLQHRASTFVGNMVEGYSQHVAPVGKNATGYLTFGEIQVRGTPVYVFGVADNGPGFRDEEARVSIMDAVQRGARFGKSKNLGVGLTTAIQQPNIAFVSTGTERAIFDSRNIIKRLGPTVQINADQTYQDQFPMSGTTQVGFFFDVEDAQLSDAIYADVKATLSALIEEEPTFLSQSETRLNIDHGAAMWKRPGKGQDEVIQKRVNVSEGDFEYAQGVLLGVADGYKGDFASKKAKNYVQREDVFEDLMKQSQGNVIWSLAKLYQQLNDEIMDGILQAEFDEDEDIVGTTLSLGYITEDNQGKRKAYIAVIGDSPAVIIDKDGHYKFIGPRHGYDNIVAKALGGSASRSSSRHFPEIFEVELEDGDQIVFMSDGAQMKPTDSRVRGETTLAYFHMAGLKIQRYHGNPDDLRKIEEVGYHAYSNSELFAIKAIQKRDQASDIAMTAQQVALEIVRFVPHGDDVAVLVGKVKPEVAEPSASSETRVLAPSQVGGDIADVFTEAYQSWNEGPMSHLALQSLGQSVAKVFPGENSRGPGTIQEFERLKETIVILLRDTPISERTRAIIEARTEDEKKDAPNDFEVSPDEFIEMLEILESLNWSGQRRIISEYDSRKLMETYRYLHEVNREGTEDLSRLFGKKTYAFNTVRQLIASIAERQIKQREPEHVEDLDENFELRKSKTFHFSLENGFSEEERLEIHLKDAVSEDDPKKFFKENPHLALKPFELIAERPDVEVSHALRGALLENAGDFKYWVANKRTTDPKALHPVHASFVNLLKSPKPVTARLWEMHRLGLLASYIPEIAGIHNGVADTRFHEYSVDQHSLYNLQVFDDIATNRDAYAFSRIADSGGYDRILSNPNDVLAFRLALLFHDAGKDEHFEAAADHAIRGAQLHIPERLEEFSEAVPEVREAILPVAWIVRNHMVLNMTIINRELHRFPADQIDLVETLIEDRQVDSQMLNMIYLISLTDYISTRPNDYKFKDGYRPERQWGGMVPAYLDHFGALHSVYEQASEILSIPVAGRQAKLDEIKEGRKAAKKESRDVYMNSKKHDIKLLIERENGEEIRQSIQDYFNAIPDGDDYAQTKSDDIQEAVVEMIEGSLDDLFEEYRRIFPYAYLTSLARETNEHLRRLIFLAHLRVLKNPPNGEGPIRTPILLFYKDYDRYYEKHYEIIVGFAEDQVGVVSKATGTLWANGIDVHGADLNTETDGTIVDRFFGFRESEDVPIEEAQAHIWKDLVEVTDPGSSVSLVTVFKRRNKEYISRKGRFFEYVETQVKFRESDEEVNGKLVSVLDVTHADQAGLLHVISEGLFSRGINIAKLPAKTFSPVAQNAIYINIDKKALSDQQKDDVERFISELLAKGDIDVVEIRSETRTQVEFEMEWPQSENITVQYEVDQNHGYYGLNAEALTPQAIETDLLEVFQSYPGYWSFVKAIETVMGSADYLELNLGTPEFGTRLDSRFKLRLYKTGDDDTVQFDIYYTFDLELAKDVPVYAKPEPIATGTMDVVETSDQRLQVRLENQKFRQEELSTVRLDSSIQQEQHPFWGGEAELPRKYKRLKKLLRRFFIDNQYVTDEVLIKFLADVRKEEASTRLPKYFKFLPDYVIRFAYMPDQGKWAFFIDHRPDDDSRQVSASNPVVVGRMELLKTIDDASKSETRAHEDSKDLEQPIDELVTLDSVIPVASQILSHSDGKLTKILILEDDEDHVQRYVNQVIIPLQDQGYDFEYQFEQNGLKGLTEHDEAIQRGEPFHLAISDRQMPVGGDEISGPESKNTGDYFIHKVSQHRGRDVKATPIPIIINSTETATHIIGDYDNVALYVGKNLGNHQIGSETYNAYGLIREVLKGAFDKIAEDEKSKSETRLENLLDQASQHYVQWYRLRGQANVVNHAEELSRLVVVSEQYQLEGFLNDLEQKVIARYQQESNDLAVRHGNKALDIISRLKGFIQTKYQERKAIVGLAPEKGREVHYLDALRELNGSIGELYVHGHVGKELMSSIGNEGILARPNNSLTTFDEAEQGFVPLVEAQNAKRVQGLSKILRIGLQSQGYEQGDSIAYYDYAVAVLMEFALAVVAVDKLTPEEVEWINRIADAEELSNEDQEKLNRIQGELLGEIRKVLGFNLATSLDLRGGELQLFMTQIHQLISQHEISLQVRKSA